MAYTINGQAQDLPDPIDEEGVTLLPLAPLVEVMGGYVYWNNDSKEAIIEMNDKKYSVTAGDGNLIADGSVLTLSALPVIENNRLYVPADFFEAGLGCSIEVSGENVTLSSPA